MVDLAAPPDSGRLGKSSRGSVGMRDSNRSADTFTPVPPLSVSSLTSASGSARAHDFLRLLARQGPGPRLFHRRFTAAAQRHLEIRGKQRELVARGLDQ